METVHLAPCDCLRREAWLVPHLIREEISGEAVPGLMDRVLLALHALGLGRGQAHHALHPSCTALSEQYSYSRHLDGGANEHREIGLTTEDDPIGAVFSRAAEHGDYSDLCRTIWLGYLRAALPEMATCRPGAHRTLLYTRGKGLRAKGKGGLS